jgi:hypothetical protein
LLRVDILAGRVYRDRSTTTVRSSRFHLPGAGDGGAITPVQDDDGWLLAAGRGFAYLSVDGTLLPVAEESRRTGPG